MLEKKWKKKMKKKKKEILLVEHSEPGVTLSASQSSVRKTMYQKKSDSSLLHPTKNSDICTKKQTNGPKKGGRNWGSTVGYKNHGMHNILWQWYRGKCYCIFF